MSKLICIGMLESAVYSKMHRISRAVYDENGTSPTIHTSGGGNTEIKVLIHENEQTDGTDNDIAR
nr:MAG TPA: hypothetical protein [Caudoviricetes sp.]